jgi:UDP-N-acetylglucosamine--dolichyl-phosphate N-acetylglucosaminephosphotransferase
MVGSALTNLYLFILIVATSFFSTLFLTKVWIKVAKKFKLVGKDMNKYPKVEVPEGGGVAFILGTTFAVLVYVFIKTFYLGSTSNLVEILSITNVILLAGFLGFVDDILGWKAGLQQWQKPLLTIPIAIPLMVINAGSSSMFIPFIGNVNLGILYPLLIVPIGVVGAANGFNMLAGLNGLEASMGTIILSTLGLVAYSNGALWLATIAFSAVFSLLGFLIFNRYPAKVFPGNSLTYAVGALIACVAILGNMERIAVFLFAPYFIELVIKAKNKFRTECFGIPQKDSSLKPPKKVGSLTHILLKFAKSEKGVVYSLLVIEILLAFLVLLWFKPF